MRQTLPLMSHPSQGQAAHPQRKDREAPEASVLCAPHLRNGMWSAVEISSFGVKGWVKSPRYALRALSDKGKLRWKCAEQEAGWALAPWSTKHTVDILTETVRLPRPLSIANWYPFMIPMVILVEWHDKLGRLAIHFSLDYYKALHGYNFLFAFTMTRGWAVFSFVLTESINIAASGDGKRTVPKNYKI